MIHKKMSFGINRIKYLLYLYKLKRSSSRTKCACVCVRVYGMVMLWVVCNPREIALKSR